jgi:hypothetical protein
LKRRRETHRYDGTIYRAAFVVAGAVIVLCGLAMLVLRRPCRPATPANEA